MIEVTEETAGEITTAVGEMATLIVAAMAGVEKTAAAAVVGDTKTTETKIEDDARDLVKDPRKDLVKIIGSEIGIGTLRGIGIVTVTVTVKNGDSYK